jgi:8-oxo-dGTP pyrophosphatase MutT (NUDIX family)
VAVKHGTSSVFVFCRMRAGWRIGLIRHPRFARMMLPGGHIEPGESPAQAALREVAEETGLAVRLIGPPAAPLPAGYQPPRVSPPWWMAEYDVPPDKHEAAPHVHIDYLYVGVAEGSESESRPAHPFGWYAVSDLPGLDMFDDARILASALMAGLDAVGAGSEDAELAAAILAWLRASAHLPG